MSSGGFMSCGTCCDSNTCNTPGCDCRSGYYNAKKKGICPISFGLAFGITCAFGVFIWSVWLMKYGVPPMLVGHMPEPTFTLTSVQAFWAFFQGFFFGLFVALFYDLFIWCKCCRKKSAEVCSDKTRVDQNKQL